MLSLIKSRILINLYGYARGLIYNERSFRRQLLKCDEYTASK
ncbi:hypothetical protein [Candidatus Lariskella endosymbiont of Epinotia ramella]